MLPTQNKTPSAANNATHPTTSTQKSRSTPSNRPQKSKLLQKHQQQN